MSWLAILTSHAQFCEVPALVVKITSSVADRGATRSPWWIPGIVQPQQEDSPCQCHHHLILRRPARSSLWCAHLGPGALRSCLPYSLLHRNSEPGACLELLFYTEDPYCHLAFGKSCSSMGLVLCHFSPQAQGWPHPAPRAEVNIPTSAWHVRWNARVIDNTTPLETDDGDVMMSIPPLF
jgi:hypothetical protein